MSNLYKFILLLVAPLLFQAHLYAASMEEGRAAIKAGEFEKAQHIFREHAEKGNARAQRSMGIIYFNGMGVIQDYAQAIEWYKRASNSGDDVAPYAIASLYFNGVGVKEDHKEALKWMTESAKRGYVKAQYKLGRFYDTGVNGMLTPDYESAFDWYRKAAEQNHMEAQKKLADLYLYGRGIETDPVAAFTWSMKAAEQGGASAQFHVASMYQEGLGVGKSLRDAEIWYKKAQAQGFTVAAINLALINRQYEKVFELYEFVAGAGHPDGQRLLGTCYANGTGTTKNINMAVTWFEKAAKQEDAQAMAYLAAAFVQGDMPHDPVVAYAWITLAMEHADKEKKQMMMDSQAKIGLQLSRGQRQQAEAKYAALIREIEQQEATASGIHAWPPLPKVRRK